MAIVVDLAETCGGTSGTVVANTAFAGGSDFFGGIVSRHVSFALLGPLRVAVGGVPVDIRARRDRVVLIMLLLNGNSAVPVEALIDAVWGRLPPATARGQIHTCISRLRAVLRDTDGAVIRRVASGYLVTSDFSTIDAVAFDRLRARAGVARSEGRPAAAASLLREALDLWRSTALCDIPADALVAHAHRLNEQRWSVLEECVQLERDHALVRTTADELRVAIGEQPYRERLRSLLMRVLHRDGRRAEALEVYWDARRLLRDELGVEPGAELRAAQCAALSAPRRYPRPRRRQTGTGWSERRRYPRSFSCGRRGRTPGARS